MYTRSYIKHELVCFHQWRSKMCLHSCDLWELGLTQVYSTSGLIVWLLNHFSLHKTGVCMWFILCLSVGKVRKHPPHDLCKMMQVLPRHCAFLWVIPILTHNTRVEHTFSISFPTGQSYGRLMCITTHIPMSPPHVYFSQIQPFILTTAYNSWLVGVVLYGTV